MKGGRRPPEPTPPSWLDSLPVADWDNMQEGYYLIAASVQVNTNRYLDNIIVKATPREDSVGLAVIYVGSVSLHGLYYYEIADSFVYNFAWGNYSPATIAAHINSALGSTFVGDTVIQVDEVVISKDDILGKLIPVEP